MVLHRLWERWPFPDHATQRQVELCDVETQGGLEFLLVALVLTFEVRHYLADSPLLDLVPGYCMLRVEAVELRAGHC